MLLAEDRIPQISGRRGEWASLDYANVAHRWRYWRGAAIAIGPVLEAYEGSRPDYDNRFKFDTPTIIICGRVAARTCRMPDQDPLHGILVDYPLVYDEAEKAFAELFNTEQEPVHHLWVSNGNARALQAIRGTVPFVDGVGRRSVVNAVELSECRR